MATRFLFVTGGVLSGLGKGITASSVGLLLQAAGFTVTAVKCDMYLNLDAGTMNPIEHGEVFVTADGVETDQDMGHYERFLHVDLHRENYITAGQVYRHVLEKERRLEYKGKCVDAYLDVPEEIIRRFHQIAKSTKADFIVIELGGTVGEYQNILFFEAIRRMKVKYPRRVLVMHVGYLPVPHHLGEMKTKPLQQSILELHRLGLSADMVVGRSEKSMDEKRKQKVAYGAGIRTEDIFSNPDLDTIYRVPIFLEEQGMTDRLLKKFSLKRKKKDLKEWKALIRRIDQAKEPVKIAIVGKYFTSGEFSLEDSYVCVIEAIKHAAWELGLKPEITWFNSEEFEGKNVQDVLSKQLSGFDGIIVPQGWGNRGVEGKIATVEYARKQKVPYLGLCFGMQMAIIEFARHMCGLNDANSTEVNPKTPYPVIHIMDDQKKLLQKKQYGGTIRLGQWPCKLASGSLVFNAYKKSLVLERHRHRYEVNNSFRDLFESKGLRIAGVSPDDTLVEAIELTDHPFFVGTQFHPELQSRPLTPHPLFVAFLKACRAH